MVGRVMVVPFVPLEVHTVGGVVVKLTGKPDEAAAHRRVRPEDTDWCARLPAASDQGPRCDQMPMSTLRRRTTSISGQVINVARVTAVMRLSTAMLIIALLVSSVADPMCGTMIAFGS